MPVPHCIQMALVKRRLVGKACAERRSRGSQRDARVWPDNNRTPTTLGARLEISDEPWAVKYGAASNSFDQLPPARRFRRGRL